MAPMGMGSKPMMDEARAKGQKAEVKLWYRDHTTDGVMKRVWREGWPSDAFEIINGRDWEYLERFCKQFTIPLEEAPD